MRHLGGRARAPLHRGQSRADRRQGHGCGRGHQPDSYARTQPDRTRSGLSSQVIPSTPVPLEYSIGWFGWSTHRHDYATWQAACEQAISSARACRDARATFMPDTAWPGPQAPARLIPGKIPAHSTEQPAVVSDLPLHGRSRAWRNKMSDVQSLSRANPAAFH
jgi:hypothetical protein